MDQGRKEMTEPIIAIPIRRNTKYEALDILKTLITSITNDADHKIESGMVDKLMHVKVYSSPEHVALLLGRNHIIKDSLVNILRVICRANEADDIYIRFEKK